MDLLTVVIVIVVVGVVLLAINKYVPMQAQIKEILNWVVVIGLVIWLLSAFGVFDLIRGVRVGR